MIVITETRSVAGVKSANAETEETETEETETRTGIERGTATGIGTGIGIENDAGAKARTGERRSATLTRNAGAAREKDISTVAEALVLYGKKQTEHYKLVLHRVSPFWCCQLQLVLN